MTDQITEAEANKLLDNLNNVIDAPVQGSKKKKKVQKPTETTEGENTNSGTDQQETMLEITNQANDVPETNAVDNIQNEPLPSAANYSVNVAQEIYGGSGKAVILREGRIFLLREITIRDDEEKKKLFEAAPSERLGLVQQYLEQTKKRKRESSETTVTSAKKRKSTTS